MERPAEPGSPCPSPSLGSGSGCDRTPPPPPGEPGTGPGAGAGAGAVARGSRLHNARTGRAPKNLSFGSAPAACQDDAILQGAEDDDQDFVEMAATPGAVSAPGCLSWCCQVGAVFPLRPGGPGGRSLPSSVVLSGPGPSPGSQSACSAATSCSDDSCRPAPKNCYRLIVAGSPRVGKSSLVARFLNSKFPDDHKPTIEEFYRKLYRIRGEVFQMDVLDTSGYDPFPALRRTSYLTGDLFVLVFAMDNRDSYEEALRLREQILDTHLAAWHAAGPKRPPNPPRVPMVLAGNKADAVPRAVSPTEPSGFVASAECCDFVEVSALRNEGVGELFGRLLELAGLPREMAPEQHRRVQAPLGAPCSLPPPQPPPKKCTLSIKRRLSDACGVVTPNVRRPSIRTDLSIMRAKTGTRSAGRSTSRPLCALQ